MPLLCSQRGNNNSVGALIGSSGAILTWIMCVAMNRDITNVLFGGVNTVSALSQGGEAMRIEGTHTEIDTGGVVQALVNAERVVIVPGYGLAVAKAQYAIAE